MIKNLIAALLFLCTINLNSQTKKEQDQKAIKGMCGCFEVSFNFAETFNNSKDSDYQKSKVKREKALEWVQLIEDMDNKIGMQHILIVETPSKPHIVKHWRQDWIFENNLFHMYDFDNKWKFIEKSKSNVSGQWTQKVYQVDDSPRYEGSSTWVHVDGRSFWLNTTDAPLPRREITVRNDYNVTVRRNHHEVFDWGWIHNQDNDKLVRREGKEDFILAQEKGFNTYKRIDDSRCIPAREYWEEYSKMWKLVRNNWDKIYKKNQNLELKHSVENKRLFQYIFEMNPSTKNKKIKKVIDNFIM